MKNIFFNMGWCTFFEEQLTKEESQQFIIARITQEHRGIYKVKTEMGDFVVRIPGKLKFGSSDLRGKIVVGDWVLININPHQDDGIIMKVLQRKNQLSRQEVGQQTQEQLIGANIDAAIIVSSCNQEFNLRRIERYLIAIRNCNIEPIVVITKTDLSTDIDQLKEDLLKIDKNISVYLVSSFTGEGIEQLGKEFHTGKTIALIGSSGVEKSTLLNRICKSELQKTGDIRSDDDKGRHVTTSRSLLEVPTGGYILDTPGMRELQLWEEHGGISATFSDIEQLKSNCQFSNCQHESEPNCAINRAIEDGKLSYDRYLSYQKFCREQNYNRKKMESRSSIEEKRKIKLQMARSLRKELKQTGEGKYDNRNR